MRIGIDVGGTNTDAVIMDGRTVVAAVKTSTTPDVTTGVVNGLSAVLEQYGGDVARIEATMIGTTHFTNAVVEVSSRLLPVGVLRVGLPATRGVPPFSDWPARLRESVEGVVRMCRGGHEFDGREIAPLDVAEIRAAARDFTAAGIRSVAVSSVFSPMNESLELRVRDLLVEELGQTSITLSHEMGGLGLLERENAAIINACLTDLAEDIAAAFDEAVRSCGLTSPIFVSQNDGTLMTIEQAKRSPVATFASGPTNSMRGAALLTGERNCIVIDVGGTTADYGVLRDGFPRRSAVNAPIGGVRTNLRMPDVLSLGLGGGSRIHGRGADLAIGPDSVGYALTEVARVFGGDEVTATDVAVGGGRCELGDPSLVGDLDDEVVAGALAMIDRSIADGLDRMKTSAEPVRVVVVGGGSIIVADEIPGAARLTKPEHFAVANAVGAAIAQVGATVDHIFSLDEGTREQALSAAERAARELAVEAGAAEETVVVMDVEETQLGYLGGNVRRISLRAVGDLKIGAGDNAATV